MFNPDAHLKTVSWTNLLCIAVVVWLYSINPIRVAIGLNGHGLGFSIGWRLLLVFGCWHSFVWVNSAYSRFTGLQCQDDRGLFLMGCSPL
jgi:hypothetical protein